MKRWLSFVKRHVMPGPWVKPVKERRPLTILTTHTVVQSARPRSPTPEADYYVTAPLVPLRHPRPLAPPLCDVDLIMERYAGWSPTPDIVPPPSAARPDSQVLPFCDIALPPQAYVDYAFISFEPTYKVTVSEVEPYCLQLRKPRFERLKKAVSFIPGVGNGQVRFSFNFHDCQ